MKNIIKKLPIPIAGLMLAVASLGNLLVAYGNIFKDICGALSLIILILLICKFIFFTKDSIESLDNPVVCSVLPTFSMGIMILSTYLKPYSNMAGKYVFYFGIVLHIILLIYFTKKYMLDFKIQRVFPSYFIVYVGISAASIAAPAFELFSLGQGLFWFGFVSYIALLPVILYRVFKVKSIPEPALPTIAIFTAPASLCLAGYLSSFKEVNPVIFTILLVLSVVSFIGVICYMIKMLSLRFYPSYSAFTFPFVITAIATKKSYGYLMTNEGNVYLINYLVKFQEIIAVILVVYVLLRYVMFIFKKNIKPTVKA